MFFLKKEKEKKKGKKRVGESAKINIFASAVQPQEKYEHVGEEIKMIDLLADMCVCAHLFGGEGCHNCAIVPFARRFQVWHATFEAYMQE